MLSPLKTSYLFAGAIVLALAPAAHAFDFSCDFDESSGGLSVDGSCDGSTDANGSFDFSCDFSHDDDLNDTYVSADFDGSCDALGDDRFSCDYSSSFDYDSPLRSVSGSLSCDTVGHADSLEIRCRDAGDRPDVNEFFDQILVTCGDPFEIPYFVLAEVGDLGTVKALLDEMQLALAEVDEFKKRRKVQRQVAKIEKLLAKAELLYLKAQALLRNAGGEIRSADVDRLCEASLYCER